jgi:hypothetical protein
MTFDPERESAAEPALRSYRDQAPAMFRPVPTDVIVNRGRHRTRVRAALAAAAVVAAIAGGATTVIGGYLSPDRTEPIVTPTPGPVTSTASSAPTPSRIPSTAPSGSPSEATTSAPPASQPSSNGIFSGRRAVTIGMESGPPSILILDGNGKLVGGQAVNDRSRFVLVPAGDAFQIRTETGDPACLGVRNTEDGPPTVWAATCRASATGQQFTFTRTGDTDSRGRTTYTIGTAYGQLTFSSIDGLHIAEDGRTGFSLQDRGPAG